MCSFGTISCYAVFQVGAVFHNMAIMVRVIRIASTDSIVDCISLVTRLSPCAIVKFACKEGESLVYFDHVLYVVGCGYPLTANFVHIRESITRPKAHLRGKKLTTSNHIQHVIKIYQALLFNLFSREKSRPVLSHNTTHLS